MQKCIDPLWVADQIALTDQLSQLAECLQTEMGFLLDARRNNRNSRKLLSREQAFQIAFERKAEIAGQSPDNREQQRENEQREFNCQAERPAGHHHISPAANVIRPESV